MRPLIGVGLAFLLSAAGFAQQRFVGGFNTFGSKSGFGSVVFPGTGHAPGTFHPFSITNPGFAHNLGGVVSGLRPYTGAPAGRRGGRAPLVIPYAYPVYLGGGGYYQEPQQPNVTVVYPQQQPPVIINQIFPTETARPVMREYGPDTASSGVHVYQGPARPALEATQPSEENSNYYLIAFKDHSIYSAVGYWVDGETLHYLTANNTHNQASLSLVDRELTQQLNKGRGVEVRLPPAR